MSNALLQKYLSLHDEGTDWLITGGVLEEHQWAMPLSCCEKDASYSLRGYEWMEKHISSLLRLGRGSDSLIR